VKALIAYRCADDKGNEMTVDVPYAHWLERFISLFPKVTMVYTYVELAMNLRHIANIEAFEDAARRDEVGF
jgi:hypothetical protein